MAIEELENLNRDLAAIVETIPEHGCVEFARRACRRKVTRHVHHLADGLPHKEVIGRDFVDLPRRASSFSRRRTSPSGMAEAPARS